MRWTILVACVAVSFAQSSFVQSFEVASLKPNPRPAGRDYRGSFVVTPERVSAHNVSLKDMILEAYGIEPYQLFGGPGWLDNDEFDLDAKTGGAVPREEMRAMLRGLLSERFHLAVRKETRHLRGYLLVVDSGGPKVRPDGSAANGGFHGEMRQLARFLSVKLTIPAPMDPNRPAIASGTPIPVIDKTGLAGTYHFQFDIAPEVGGDSFVMWQRFLQQSLGLKLKADHVPVECIVVERAERPRDEL